MTTDKYILTEDKEIVPEHDMVKWGRFMENGNRIVKQEQIENCTVSTVFLGLDHQYYDGPPILWESIVFGGDMDGGQDRCSGEFKDAQAMHERMVEKVKSYNKPPEQTHE